LKNTSLGIVIMFLVVSSLSGDYYKGYDCIGDCSGHEAGYQWAEDNDINNPDDCGGNSNSFIEGCESYAEENEDEEK
jgi:hypothetical protein